MSVRAKFALIIGLCVLPLAAATWFLSVALEREQHEDGLVRVQAAQRAFESGLAEDVSRLQIAVRMLTTDAEVARALDPLDRAELHHHVEQFGKVWPGLRVLIAGASGQLLASSTPDAPAGSLASLPELRAALSGKGFEGVARLAREPGAGERPGSSYAVVHPVERAGRVVGAVLAAFPLDDQYLETAQLRQRLGLTLAIGGQVVARSSQAPHEEHALTPGKLELHEERGRVTAQSPFTPALLAGPPPGVVTASLDLTEVTRDHRRFLLYRLLSVAAVALVALVVAALIARKMHASVGELNRVLPGMAQSRYEPVNVVHTGDELQQLAETWNRICGQLKEAELWKRALGKYLSRGALEAIKKGDLALGGTTLKATVLFSDIRGFTALAERMPPEKLLGILNRYFTEMVGAVIKNDGIVDKFIGDCIMAVWGPPTPGQSDAQGAVRAAQEMRVRLRKLNLEFAAQGLPELRTGIGIHTGDVVAGNIGAEGEGSLAGKMEYTVIGDTVNLASRLESMTKELKVDVLLSEDTFRLAGAGVEAERIGQVAVRGREQAVQVYKLT